MDAIFITVYCSRMARKRCSFNETIIYCKASNLNKCMAVPLCVCLGVTEREGGSEGGRQAVRVRRHLPVNANKVAAQSDSAVLL